MNDSNTIDQQFIEFIVKSLVGNPDAVQIERRIDEKGVLLELTVDAEDLGRVIGKRGATAQSLRTLLRALGTKNDARYNLKIIDNGEGGHGYDRAPASDSSSNSYRAQDDSSVASNSSVDDSTSTSSAAATSGAVADDGDNGVSEPTVSDAVARTRKELADLDDLDL